jgi:ABC-type nitrate/sulfonate/bicarbonate transport system permease component
MSSASAAWLVRSIQLAIIVAVVLVWHWVTQAGLVSKWLLPPPQAVLGELMKVLRSGTIVSDLLVTLAELALAFAIATIAGIIVGYLVGRSRLLTASFEPLLAALFAIPIVVFYPLCILYFGLGPASKIVFGALHGFFPIVLATVVGFSTVDRRLLEAASSMGASDRQILGLVLLPAALPMVLSGVRMGVTLTFLAIIGGETLGAVAGIGHRIVWAAEAMDIALMYSYIVITVGISALLYAGVACFESHRMREVPS